jgi:hypothetical protein
MAAGASVVFAPSLHVQQGTAFHTATPLFLFLRGQKKKRGDDHRACTVYVTVL